LCEAATNADEVVGATTISRAGTILNLSLCPGIISIPPHPPSAPSPPLRSAGEKALDVCREPPLSLSS